MKGIRKNQEGQILLITLLVLSLAATVVLSIIGRTTTDISISNQITESSQAFAAAEAGIEEALRTGITPGRQTVSSGASFDATVNPVGGATGIYQYPGQITPDQAATIWLVGHNADGTLADSASAYTASTIDICWADASPIPAMTVAFFYKSAGVYKVVRGAYDPDATRRGINNFLAPTATTGGCGGGTNTTYKQTINFGTSFTPAIIPASDILLAMRIVPVYANTQFTVNVPSPQILPLQGSRIDSQGTTGAGTTRKIVVFQQYRTPPAIFDNVIYSQGSFGH